MKTQHEINTYLENRGYDIFPVKQPNGMYKCDLYIKDQFAKTGEKEYNTWEQAKIETSKLIYEKIN